jgi:DNA-binding response OmpR family regulator
MLVGKRILVVDDEAGIRELASRALLAAGFEVVTAGDGGQAVKVMEAQHIDLAIVDIVMPEKEGVETIIEFKTRWPDCKIIAISGGGGRIGPETFLTLADAFGADVTMRKPLSFSQLVQTAGELLGTRAVA